MLSVFRYFSEKVSFIDFEYIGYNYQAFDIGNHFCEYAGQHVAVMSFDELSAAYLAKRFFYI